MRGLKLGYGACLYLAVFASITDAWIETHKRCKLALSNQFASITDAWIETQKVRAIYTEFVSHPSRMRGLKLAYAPVMPIVSFRIHHGCVD